MNIPKNLLKIKNFEEFIYYMGMPTKEELNRISDNLKKNGFYTPEEIEKMGGKKIIKPKSIPEYMMMFGFKEVYRKNTPGKPDIVTMELVKKSN